LAACEHPTLVKEEMLKHAAEEFRHAYYLKQQMSKLQTHELKTYAMNSMLGGYYTLHYLQKLNLQVSKLLKRTYQLSGHAFNEAIYALNSYAIEVRAKALYPAYQKVLKSTGCRVTVRAIIIEEERHLEEMQALIHGLPHGQAMADAACRFEEALYQAWLQALLPSNPTKGIDQIKEFRRRPCAIY
jgi:hypothetical protein